MAEIPIDPRLLVSTDTAFRDAVRTFMRTHAPSANTAHLRDELQGLVDAFLATSQDLSMQQLLHMIHTQYNLDALVERAVLVTLTANVTAYIQSTTAQYLQNTRPTTHWPYQESSYLQSFGQESFQSDKLAANIVCEESTNLQSVAAENDHDLQHGTPTTYTFIQEYTDHGLNHVLRTALAAAPATNAQNLRFIIVTPAEAAELDEEEIASATRRSLNLAGLSSRFNNRPSAGDNSWKCSHKQSPSSPSTLLSK